MIIYQIFTIELSSFSAQLVNNSFYQNSLNRIDIASANIKVVTIIDLVY